MAVALPLFGAFVLGLGSRRWLRRHFALLFRLQFGVGLGTLAVLSGWSFELSGRNVAALGALLVAQLSAVGVAARVFRSRDDGPLLAFAALHFTIVPSVLAAATLLGVALPGSAWIFAFGPLPISLVSLARLYGYSTRTAATGLALSVAISLAILPAVLSLT